MFILFRSLIDRPVYELFSPGCNICFDRDGECISNTVSRVLPGTVTDCSVSNRRRNLFKKNGFHLTAKRIPSDLKIAKSFGIVQCGNPIRYVPMSKTRKVVTSAISVIHKFAMSTTLRYIGRIDLLMTETFRQRFKKSILVISPSTEGKIHTLHGKVFSPMRIFFYYY